MKYLEHRMRRAIQDRMHSPDQPWEWEILNREAGPGVGPEDFHSQLAEMTAGPRKGPKGKGSQRPEQLELPFTDEPE